MIKFTPHQIRLLRLAVAHAVNNPEKYGWIDGKPVTVEEWSDLSDILSFNENEADEADDYFLTDKDMDAMHDAVDDAFPR